MSTTTSAPQPSVPEKEKTAHSARTIPIPLRQRWHDARLRIVPVVSFCGAIAGIALLWKSNIAAPTLVGQAEPNESKVSCYKPGMLAQLDVARFQKVKAGDPVGQVLVTDPKILASSLSVIQAEIEALRVSMQPIARQQHTAMEYSSLQLDWMKQRAQLAMAQVNLQLAQSELQRTEALYKDKIISQRVYEQAKASRDRYKTEVDELNRIVNEQSKDVAQPQATNTIELSQLSDQPLRAAIAVQESKLRLTEAELSPITLKAPVDGMVNLIFHRSGEAIIAGEPIVTIAAYNPVRIVSYVRAPVMTEPSVGTRVEVRSRGPRREVGIANIIEVGTQLETVAPALASPVKFSTVELGLPISVSLPSNLKIRPGELVDLTLLSTDN
jgi:multidrug resistance efflux pump